VSATYLLLFRAVLLFTQYIICAFCLLSLQQSADDVSQFDSKFTSQTPVDSPDDSTLSESANQAFLVTSQCIFFHFCWRWWCFSSWCHTKTSFSLNSSQSVTTSTIISSSHWLCIQLEPSFFFLKFVLGFYICCPVGLGQHQRKVLIWAKNPFTSTYHRQPKNASQVCQPVRSRCFREESNCRIHKCWTDTKTNSPARIPHSYFVLSAPGGPVAPSSPAEDRVSSSLLRTRQWKCPLQSRWTSQTAPRPRRLSPSVSLPGPTWLRWSSRLTLSWPNGPSIYVWTYDPWLSFSFFFFFSFVDIF